MKVKDELIELRNLDHDALQDQLAELLKKQFQLRMQYKGAQLTDLSQLSKIKKSIARAQTVLQEIRNAR